MKWHGLFHLIYSLGFVSIIVCTILSVPLILVRSYYPQYDTFFKATSIIALSFLIYIIHYFISYTKNAAGSFGENILGFIIRFPLFIALFIGVSLNNAIGIIQGYSGIKSGFVRTPKFNTASVANKFHKNKYTQINIDRITVMEGILIFYFLFGIILSFRFKNYAIVPLLIIAAAGFSIVFISTITERNSILKKHD